MTTVLSALIVLFLFHAPPTLAASGDPDPQAETPSAFTPEAPPEACRDCAGVQYYRPSAAGRSAPLTPALSFQGSGGEEGQGRGPSKGTSGAPVKLEPEGPARRTHLSSDPRVNAARRLLERNRFAEALAILRPLATDHPDQTDVRFLLGLAASRGSQTTGLEDEIRLALLDEAIAAFRSILIRQPGLVRVRLELALAFYLKENDQLAREHFERALVGKPPEALVANINRFLTVMRARRRWQGYFGFSIAPDTNINAASDADVIYINVNGQSLPFSRGAQGRVSSGIGIVGWGGGEYQYPLAERWRLRTGINVNHREYKGSQFDQTFIGGFVGPRWLITPATEISLLATASQRWFGGSSFNYDYGTRLEVEHRVFAGLRLSGRAMWSDRKYQQLKFLEGPLMVFSLGTNYVLFPTVQVNALVGYQQQEAVANRWNSAGYWTRVGTNVALPWGFTVGASAEFRWTNYEAGWPVPFRPDGSARRDQTRILSATLLNRAITVFGFSPQVAFSNQVRESNAQLFDFKRNLVEMRWVRQF
ncbi:MAG: DUF560 domain-containing protein [Candidatus Latescibacteria bacterium]|nr:DUF560 domain-containing protein [Candidatus Latescibacterota bacterium]